MKNIWRLFVSDLKRMGGNTITAIVILGLVAIPSIFSWYNMLASWNVFDNTGNLTVAVANADAGYESDLVPLEVNIGDRVVSALRENTQLNWVFTNVDDAVDGTRSGRYYAAVVIPETFSRDMMTFYSPDVEHATILYYSNEKKSAIAPKVTDQGADRVSAQINSVFTETLSEVGLGMAQSLLRHSDETELNDRLTRMSAHLTEIGKQMDDAAAVIGLYVLTLKSAQSLAEDARALLIEANSSASDAADKTRDAKVAAEQVDEGLSTATEQLSSTADKVADEYAGIPTSLDAAISSASDLADESSSQLRSFAASTEDLADEYDDLASKLEDVKASLPEGQWEALDSAITSLGSSANLQRRLSDSLNDAADAVDKGLSDVSVDRKEAIRLADEARASLQEVRTDYEDNVEPALSRLADTAAEAGDSLSNAATLVQQAGDDAANEAEEISAKLASTQSQLEQASASLKDSAGAMRQLGADLASAAQSGDSQMLQELLGTDPATFAAELTTPVVVERHAIYPVENFGSAMSPLYTTLALWIGALLMMVTLKVIPSRRTVSELDNPTLAQLFCGRFGIVAVISLMQSTVVAVGNLLFLRVQAEEPFLYLLCFWVSGLVFAFIIYTMVASFGNLGKGLGVLLLILQVTGGGGSFPLPLLPQFFQDISPYLPIAHVVNAMRAAMFGVYQADFWMEMGILLLFTVPFILLGMVLRNPLVKVISRFVEKVESTKLM